MLQQNLELVKSNKKEARILILASFYNIMDYYLNFSNKALVNLIPSSSEILSPSNSIPT